MFVPELTVRPSQDVPATQALYPMYSTWPLTGLKFVLKNVRMKE